MLIKKKRIRNLSSNLRPIQRGETLVLGVKDLERFAGTLSEIGFTKALESGESVLPCPFGPVARFNAEGKYIKHTDQPMETAYTQIEWHWNEWHGTDEVERSKIVDRPYKRYPRTFIPPPSIELRVAMTTNGEKLIIVPAIEYTEDNDEHILNVINLFLEIFGECQILKENLDEIIQATTRRLNWRVLPRGRKPWVEIAEHVRSTIERQPLGNQPVIKKRLETINQHGPDFVAIGQAGFSGYVIFGFPNKNRYVLESVNPNNATYVFDEDWEELSKKTKAEILNQNLQSDRIIHRKSWFGRVKGLLN